jgi:lysophospholipase L1-like esterase
MHVAPHAFHRLRTAAVAVAVCGLAGGMVSAAAASARAAGPDGGSVPYGSLRAAFDNSAIRGAAPNAAQPTGIDGTGSGFLAADLDRAGWTRGAQVTVNGTPYTRADVPPDAPDNAVADGQTVAVSGSGDALGFLAAATNGRFSGAGSVTYTDGTTSPYTLTVDDWSGTADEATAVTVPHRVDSAGQQTGPGRLSAVTVPLTRGRTVASVTLPPAGGGGGTPALHVFDLAMRDTTAAPNGQFWNGSWATSYGLAPAVPQTPVWTGQTLRMVVHPDLTGSTARLRFANTFSPSPLTLGHVTVATQQTAKSPVPAQTPVSLTFGGARSTTLAAGADIYSDPVSFPVTAGKSLMVSIYFPGPVAVAPTHSQALSSSFTTEPQAGDHTADVSTAAFVSKPFTFWTVVSGVDVSTPTDIGTTVAMGDSQTDCAHTAADGNQRWPDYYAQDVNSHGQVSGVVNAGLNGSRLLTGSDAYGPSALDRLDRDVFGQAGVRTLVVYYGINDIALDSASAAAVEGAVRTIAARARERGIRVVAATIPPFGGYSGYSDAKDTVREQVNAYLRTTSDVDAMADFDLATRDPDMPSRLLPVYFKAGDDHLHFNAVGTKKLADTLASGANGYPVNMSQTAAADFNGDGLADIIARDDASGELRMWLRRSDGTFADPVKVTGGWRPFGQTVAADFTGDGNADIMASDASARLQLWAGNGKGGFAAPRQVTEDWNFTQTAAADFDGDGNTDLIARDPAGNLKIWAGHGNGTFGGAAQLTGGWNFTQTAAADFNGDHQADIIAADPDGNLEMWLHNSTGHFDAPKQITGGWHFTQTAAADFDGDGAADLIARKDAIGELDSWAGRGNTTFAGAVKAVAGW